VHRYARFELDNLHAADFLKWISKSFAVQNATYDEYGDSFSIPFISLRNKDTTVVLQRESTGGSKNATYTIWCDDMDLAGELIQHMANSTGVSTLACTCDFVHEMEEFQGVLQQVEDYNSIRLKLTAEMADNSGLVKNLVIKAEDSRILGDMRLMRKTYHELFNANGDLIREYMKRATNHQNLLTALKTVNLMIQKAAKLRVGQPKTDVVTLCRKAVKASNVQKLFKIIKGDLDAA